MRLVPDAQVQSWLNDQIDGHDDFDWDSGNRDKNLKHSVSWEDVESLFGSPYFFEGRIVEPDRSEPRYLILGKDRQDRYLALVFTLRRGRLRTICCRRMRKKERDRYETHTWQIQGAKGSHH